MSLLEDWEDRTGLDKNLAANVEFVLKVVQKVFDSIYPIGTIYMSFNDANPETWMNGTTWEACGKGRVLMGAGENEANTITNFGSLAAGSIKMTEAGEKGGEISHTLNTNEMPHHGHPSRIVLNGDGQTERNVNDNWMTAGGTG